MAHRYIEERRAYRATREERAEYFITQPAKIETVFMEYPKSYHDVSVKKYVQDHHQEQQQQHASNFGHKGPTNYIHQYKRAYPQIGTYLQALDHHIAPVKKYTGAPPVMDCNEAAKKYGGIVIKEFGRNNKFHDF